MIPILSSSQIRACDEYTIENGSITSLELMERASMSFTNKFRQLYDDSYRIIIIAGTGNNGGDALAIARLLKQKHYKVRAYVVGSMEKGTPDFQANKERFKDHIQHIEKEEDFPKIERRDVIVDGIFGSGLSRPITGLIADLISHLNDSLGQIVAVDVASGLFSDKHVEDGAIVKPDVTLSFQLPKLVFFLPEAGQFVGDWYVIPIGLDQNFIQSQETSFYLLEAEDVSKYPKRRHRFSHKGEFGRLQLVCGGKGKTGAAVLAGRSAFRSGVGLLFALVPQVAQDLFHHLLVEGMTMETKDSDFISHISVEDGINAIGLGPGMGTNEETRKAFRQFLESNDSQSLILDADALNILGLDKDLLKLLPAGTILTPHPGEFERLVGDWADDFGKLQKLQELCREYKLNVVLKGSHSAICDPEGNIIFNDTGNPGMATAGSGDVLFGMVSSLVAQGISSSKALLLGVHVHGKAGDIAAEKYGERSLIASDIIDAIPEAFEKLSK